MGVRTAAIWDGPGERGVGVAKGVAGRVYLYDGNSGPYLLPLVFSMACL